MKYIVYYEFTLEAEDIEMAEREATLIAESFNNYRVKDPKLTVRGTSE